LYAPTLVAVAAGECFYFVFMLPTSQSNPEQIKNIEFETLLFLFLLLLLLLLLFLLQAGESRGGHRAGPEERRNYGI
jgi:hypothetical protein